MAPVARGLAPPFQILEPLQGRSGGEPLTVARHVADMNELIRSRCDGERPALVGSSWGAMLRLQEDGTYPAAFSAIESPVLMLHGAVDPHPGWMIRDGLQPQIPHLDYREWKECGHYPWWEAAVHQEFFAVLHDWLVRNSC
jgi:pimeloyl-ACP methyl ester carboxylesterase